MQRAAILGLAFLFAASSLQAQTKEKPKWAPSPHIAPTEPLRPAEQLKKMKVPPGFEIQLVAADPDIRKPINIAFDAAGRLWVTETIEYPYAAKDGQGRDAVKILEDFGPDGKARKITTFADKLNIPIGVIPDTDAKGALIYSIPTISHMRDSKGLGKADKREVYYSTFGVDDTHGMTGEFLRGFDGWIYACHGFRNESNVKCKDGSTSISMTSGNTYRIKADGSRIEKFTTGQVNPFGIAIDPLGNLYTGDCHSRPLTMLLRGGWYESFARPHDGLGFAPHMNTFKDHSTALCGVAYYAADQFPDTYRGKLFLGDVVLNRVNAYRLDWTGVSPAAVMENFITSQDPWFRPVDIKLGPDGCLYIADFYNRVIGHYELPLDHPARDRDKGRIWRVVWRGTGTEAGKFEPRPFTDLTKHDPVTLASYIASRNLVTRLRAADLLVEDGSREVVEIMQRNVRDIREAQRADEKLLAMWVLERLGKLSLTTLATAASSAEPAIRVHAQRILTEKKEWSPEYSKLAISGLTDENSHVKRVAAEALAAHPAGDHVGPLLALRSKVDPKDNHIVYAVRLALREQLKAKDALSALTKKLTSEDHLALADVSLPLKSEAAAQYLKTALATVKDTPDRLRTMMHHVVRHGDEDATRWAIRYAESQFAAKDGSQGEALKSIIQANQERGRALTAVERTELEAYIPRYLESANVNVKRSGAELAGMLKFAKVQPDLLTLVKTKDTPEALRKTCIDSLVSIDAKQAIAPLSDLLLSENEPIALREQVANALAGTNHPDAHAALVKTLQSSPARLQTTIALGMAGSAQGGEKLLQAIEQGKASPRLLQDRAIELRLAGAKIANVKARLKTLVQGLPPADQKTQELISKKRDDFVSFKADVDAGAKVFQKQCAICHQINSQGAKVGPQLDGIGVRGLERLLEDILDPNRNVDQAFRTTQIVTKKGQTITGLFLREEGQLIILGDKEGKEVRIDKSTIDERNVIALSPMPSNFTETIGEADFHHLLAFLLSQRGKMP